MIIKPPAPGDYPKFYHTYVGKIKGTDLLKELRAQLELYRNLFAGLSEDQLAYRYEEGKWNLKELLIHIIDSERVFTYRALRFGRGDKTPLPGFDQDSYGDGIKNTKRDIQSILNEFIAVRQSTITLFEGLEEDVMERSGEANGGSVTVRSLGYIILGHTLHHQKIIEDRYLKN